MCPCVTMCPLIWHTADIFKLMCQDVSMCHHVSIDLTHSWSFYTHVSACVHVSPCDHWFDTELIFLYSCVSLCHHMTIDLTHSWYFYTHVSACVSMCPYVTMWPSIWHTADIFRLMCQHVSMCHHVTIDLTHSWYFWTHVSACSRSLGGSIANALGTKGHSSSFEGGSSRHRSELCSVIERNFASINTKVLIDSV